MHGDEILATGSQDIPTRERGSRRRGAAVCDTASARATDSEGFLLMPRATAGAG